MKARKNRAFFVETLIITFLLLLMLTILVRIFGAAAQKSRYAERRTKAAAVAQNVVTMFEAGEGEIGAAQRQLIETAKKEFARTLPLGNRTAETPEYIRLTEVLKQMREENARLKAQLAQTRLSYAPAKEAMKSTVVSTTTPSEASRERTYVVQYDASLSKISLKMYGSAVKWRLIYEANRDILPSANSLKIGMKLRIPALKATQ